MMLDRPGTLERLEVQNLLADVTLVIKLLATPCKKYNILLSRCRYLADQDPTAILCQQGSNAIEGQWTQQFRCQGQNH